MKKIVLIVACCLLISIKSVASFNYVKDVTGVKLDLTKKYKRVVSLAPSITEIIFALGQGKKLVGVTNYCNYPAATKKNTKIGGFINPNIEKIVSLKPDLVIGTSDGNSKKAILKLRKLRIPCFILRPQSVGEISLSIIDIGKVLGILKQSQKLANKINIEIEKIKKSLRKIKKPKVFLVVGLSPLITVGAGTYEDDLLTLAGGKNIAGKSKIKYPKYNIEEIIVQKPDIIVLTEMTKKNHTFYRKFVADMKKLAKFPKEKIFYVDGDLLHRPGPRIVEGLTKLANIFNPKTRG